MMDDPGNITCLLRRWAGGDNVAMEPLFELVYRELRQTAGSLLAREIPGHVLQPTALVNEAFIKMARARKVDWHDRAQFFAFSARLMRQILVDDARHRHAKRHDAGQRVTLNTGQITGKDEDMVDLLALDQALDRLEAVDRNHARIVELRYFGGLTIPEVAAAMDASEATVSRAWRVARAWLYVALQDPEPGVSP